MTRLPADILSNPALSAVLDMIQHGGHRAYLVGGVVRNALLGAKIDDIDLATDARPEVVMDLAQQAGLKAVPTGIDHGTITVVSHGQPFEVTTFRRDVETDGRHAVVAFSDDLAEDAARRDFTMNALYADRDGQIIDPVGGLPDLQERRLRFVGDPDARIREDYLRILRFFRFLAWYGRVTQPEALAACAQLKSGLDQIAKERIGAEMRKLLAAPDPAPALHLMVKTGVLAQILPGADASSLSRLIAVEGDHAPSWPRRLSALRAPDATEALRLSRDEAKFQTTLAKAMSSNMLLAEAAYRLGPQIATDLALLRAADGATPADDWLQQIERAAAAKMPISAKDVSPPLSGPAIGHGLRTAENLWIAADFTLPAPALIDAALLAAQKPGDVE